MKYLKPIVLGLAAAGIVAYADPSVADLQSQVDQLQAHVNSMSAGAPMAGVHTNAALSQSMLSTQMGKVGNIQTLMNAQKSGALADGVTIGGFAEASAIYERVSQAGSTDVSALTTHVSDMASNTTGTGNASQLVIPRLELNVIANLNQWSMGYFSLDVRNLQLNSSQIMRVDSAFLTLGNLNQLPVYGFLGRNTIDFGSFQTVNLSTPSLNRLAFRAYGDELGIGFMNYGFSGTFAFINDNQNTTRGDGVAFNTYTKHTDGIGEYAFNLGYGMNTSGADWHIGAGYLSGSKQGVTDQTGAYDFNAKVGFAGFDVMAEFTQTIANMSAATNDKFRAWDLGGDYNFPLMGKASKVTLDYSRVSALYAASQWVVGFDHNTFNNVWMGIEYAQSKGRYVAGSSGNVYTAAAQTVPSSLTGVSDMALLFDVQGVF